MTNVGGRPVAINNDRLDTAEVVMSFPGLMIVRNDEEIVEEVNLRLEQANKYDKTISYRTYQRYKAIAFKRSQDIDTKEYPASLQILIDRFWRLLRKRMREQKLELLAQFLVDKERRKYVWLFEKRFRREFGTLEDKAEENNSLVDDTITEVEVTIIHAEHANIEDE